MNNENKAPQRQRKVKPPIMVDITKLHTPTGYAKLKGMSRANVYLHIDSGVIGPERVFVVDGQKLIAEE